jgi:hypothetical protein
MDQKEVAMKLQYRLANATWVDCGERTEEFLARCMKYGGCGDLLATVDALKLGKEVRNSPDDWYSYCRFYETSPDALREKKAAERAIETAKLRVLPSTGRRIRKLVPIGAGAPFIGQAVFPAGKQEAHVVLSLGSRVRISDDHPSLYGSHLLGHEGEWGIWVEFDVRAAP